MLGFGPISSSPISDIDDGNFLAGTMGVRCSVEGRLTDAYTTLVTRTGTYLNYTVEMNVRQGAAITTLYAATKELITLHADALPDTQFVETLKSGLRVDRSVIGTNGFGQVTVTWGEASLMNREGDYDYLLQSYSVDGQQITFKVGQRDTAYDNYYVMFAGTSTGLIAQEDIVRIKLRDDSYRLDVPASPQTYSGVGDMEGTAALAGMRKPLAFGTVRNATPVAVIPSELVFQVSFRTVSAISAVYDGAVALTGDADYATNALLRAATIADGHYATCVAEGAFRLGASAFQQITCNVLGDAVGSYVNDTANIVKRLLSVSTNVNTLSELDDASFARVTLAQPAVIGFFVPLDSDLSVADVVSELVNGVGGWGGFTRKRKYEVGIFTAPSGSPAGYYDTVDVLGPISQEPMPSGIDPAPWRFRVTYQRNWTKIDNPLGSVAESDPAYAAWLKTDYKVATSSVDDGEAILLQHPLAKDPEIVQGYFDLLADAQAEADRRLDLFSSGYWLFRVALKIHPFVHDVGNVIRLTHPRFGFAASKKVRIASLTDNVDDRTVEARVFG